LRPPVGSGTLIFVIAAPIVPADVPALCEHMRLALEKHPVRAVICDVAALRQPDAATVDALARLQLTARRLGHRVQLHSASRELRELIAFIGLSAVLQLGAASGPRAETEEREQPLRVEKRVQRDDPAV
jgi:ABC-type transporter Mla MlaB component